MARQWAQQIRSARTAAEQTSVLRALKNEIVGHPLKREAAASLGVLDPVVCLASNKTVITQTSIPHDNSFSNRRVNEEEGVRLQGLQVIGSIALGGPPFLSCLQAASVLPAILSNLCPVENPAQLVLASLRALSNLATSSALASNTHTINTNTIAESVFARPHITSLGTILLQPSISSSVNSQISLAASLIGILCRDERHQQALANSGVLDALATKLTGFVVDQGFVIPGADVLAQQEGLREYIPEATPSNIGMSVILEAISAIIANSKFRASQLLYSPPILAMFPASQPTEYIACHHARAACNAFNIAGLSVRQTQLNAMDYFLPFLPFQQLRSTSSQASAFPPLGTSSSREQLASGGRSTSNRYRSPSILTWGEASGLDSGLASQDISSSESEEPESPLIAYLIHIVRSKSGKDRLMAASVLSVFYRAGLTSKIRETTIGLLVVPLLVRMLDDDLLSSKGKDALVDDDAKTLEWGIKERAPAILAMLITDSEYLQKAAFEANVVGKLSKMLKVAYDPVTATPNPNTWSPDSNLTVDENNSLNQGQATLLVHKIKVRESTLRAIAALSPFKDEYRKAIVDQGIIPYIVESMASNPGKPSPRVNDKSEKATNGSNDTDTHLGYGINTVDVLIAACGAIRALSRSVGILRTTLIDHGVAIPVFHLLQHPDIEVQIAATATVCNLVTDVSPMRKAIEEEGLVKILCEHAHSMNAKLRLNALWALKHFVHCVNNDMKRLCLEELGQGWLVQLICDDTEDEALLSSRGKAEGRPNQDLQDGGDEDVEMGSSDDQGNSGLGASFIKSSTSRPSSSRSKSVQQAEARLAALRDAETNPAKKARKDDIAVQEQGLDFIRNLIGGAGQGGTVETTEMIDFLFNALGQDRVFEILASKLRSKVINPFNKRGSSAAETRVVPPQSEIIIAVGYILVHMAASVPRHRQLVIAQTDLLRLLVPQFNHPNIDVRLALCWLVTNLTWMDDANDSQACAQRAMALKKLGFLSKLEMLEQDPELNVRERAKSALWQMKQTY